MKTFNNRRTKRQGDALDIDPLSAASTEEAQPRESDEGLPAGAPDQPEVQLLCDAQHASTSRHALDLDVLNARGTQERFDPSSATIELKHAAPRDSAKHRFDELKINFLAHYAGTPVKSVLFVGTSCGHGASTAAFNFAASLADDADLRVLFIDADLRTSASTSSTNDRASASAETSLAQWEPNARLQAHRDNLHILPAGRGYADPAVLFQSRRFDKFLEQVSEQFDYIVIDGPALDEAPESIALSAKVDGVVLVIDAQQTRRKIALRAKRRIEEVGGRLLGVVLNRRRYYVPDWLYKRI